MHQVAIKNIEKNNLQKSQTEKKHMYLETEEMILCFYCKFLRLFIEGLSCV